MPITWWDEPRPAPDALTLREIAAEHHAWGGLTVRELKWLRGEGISFPALAWPYPVGGASVGFHDGGAIATFELDPTGDRAVTFLVDDGSRAIDIAAWSPRSGRIATWLGRAFALGEEQVFDANVYALGGALHIHPDPLAWLRADRDGIVILQPRLAHAFLAHRAALAFDDAAFGRQVQEWIKPPAPTARLLLALDEVAA